MESILVWVRQVLTTTPTRWLELTHTLAAELLSLPPAPKQWSALECLHHLSDTERQVFPVRLRALLTGQDFPRFDPDSQETQSKVQSPVALAEEFSQLRKTNLGELASITSADLDRQARHEELGIVTLGEMLNEWAAHDLMHTLQAERALMQPFIQGCRPWQPYFLEHTIQPPR